MGGKALRAADGAAKIERLARQMEQKEEEAGQQQEEQEIEPSRRRALLQQGLHGRLDPRKEAHRPAGKAVLTLLQNANEILGFALHHRPLHEELQPESSDQSQSARPDAKAILVTGD